MRALCPEIPAEKIIANVTHAHTGPSHYTEAFNFTASDRPEDRCPVHMEIASSDEYRTWLSTTMAEMVAEAWNGRKPGGIAYGYGYAVVGHSRRVCYFDDVSKRSAANATDTFAVNGHAVMYGNTNDDNFSHYEAGADHFINLLYTFDAAGKLSGAIINVPCPSQSGSLPRIIGMMCARPFAPNMAISSSCPNAPPRATFRPASCTISRRKTAASA